MVEIIRKGSQIVIVDTGRYGYRAYGISPSGAMDMRSATRANSLLHNPLDAALIECYQPGHRFVFHHATQISIAGAEAQLYLNDTRIYGHRAYSVQPGTELSVGAMSKGVRLYIGVSGGFCTRSILGSRSPLPGFLDRNLQKGDTIEYQKVGKLLPGNASISALSIDQTQTIRCSAGPEWQLLDDSIQKTLLSGEYVIHNQSDRMGYRLKGRFIQAGELSIYSGPVSPGSVQLLPSGLPLILMRDCQTTGGYPRILQVTEEDINQLAQRCPGQGVNFKLIEI